jgi:hypothetical protein
MRDAAGDGQSKKESKCKKPPRQMRGGVELLIEHSQPEGRNGK